LSPFLQLCVSIVDTKVPVGVGVVFIVGSILVSAAPELITV